MLILYFTLFFVFFGTVWLSSYSLLFFNLHKKVMLPKICNLSSCLSLSNSYFIYFALYRSFVLISSFVFSSLCFALSETQRWQLRNRSIFIYFPRISLFLSWYISFLLCSLTGIFSFAFIFFQTRRKLLRNCSAVPTLSSIRTSFLIYVVSALCLCSP